MQMDVDESRGDDKTADIDNLCVIGGAILSNGIELAVAHPDIQLAIQAARWVEQVPSSQDKAGQLSLHKVNRLLIDSIPKFVLIALYFLKVRAKRQCQIEIYSKGIRIIAQRVKKNLERDSSGEQKAAI